MATKVEVLNDPTYEQFMLMGMIQAARVIVVEANNVPRTDARKAFARAILTNPIPYVSVFKYLGIVSFDTTNWATLTETQKITGANTLVTASFNEAGNIYI